jgi:hypothetical protein
MSLPCSPGFGQQKMYRYGGSEARAGGAYKQMVGVHFGCAEGGVRVGTGKRPPGGAAAGQRVARVMGGVNTYHLSATRRGLVVFPRFASVCRTAAAGGGGGGAPSAPLRSSCRVTVQKQTPKVQTFLKSPELKLGWMCVQSWKPEILPGSGCECSVGVRVLRFACI